MLLNVLKSVLFVFSLFFCSKFYHEFHLIHIKNNYVQQIPVRGEGMFFWKIIIILKKTDSPNYSWRVPLLQQPTSKMGPKTSLHPCGPQYITVSLWAPVHHCMIWGPSTSLHPWLVRFGIFSTSKMKADISKWIRMVLMACFGMYFWCVMCTSTIHHNNWPRHVWYLYP